MSGLLAAPRLTKETYKNLYSCKSTEGTPSPLSFTTSPQSTTVLHILTGVMPFAGLHLVSLLFHILALSVPLQGTVALVVREPPFFTLPVTRRINMTGTANLVKLDQARAKVLLARSQAVSPTNGTTGVPAVNQYINYAVTVSRYSRYGLQWMTCAATFRLE